MMVMVLEHFYRIEGVMQVINVMAMVIKVMDIVIGLKLQYI